MTTDKQERKEMPITTGVLDYFPDAIAYVAHVSFKGNQQHNPGEPMHWAREKSTDQADCISRHLLERGTIDEDGVRHSGKLAWRALALLQLEIEAARKQKVRCSVDEAIAASRERRVPVGEPWKIITEQREPSRDCGIASGHADSNGIPRPALPDDGTNPTFYQILTGLGCPGKVAVGIMAGFTCTTPGDDPLRPVTYLAGPMRGYKDYNFPAFDAARDQLVKEGWRVISPADIDRHSKTTPRILTTRMVGMSPTPAVTCTATSWC